MVETDEVYKVILTLNGPIVTSRLLKCSMANSVDPDQSAPIGAVCSGSTLFASILNSSVMLGNYLQQMTSADNIFRCIFFRVKKLFISVRWCRLHITFLQTVLTQIRTNLMSGMIQTAWPSYGICNINFGKIN